MCPSCNTRRMVETAAHLTDHVFPRLPVRQWVLLVPKRLRYFMQRDGVVLNIVLRILLRVIAHMVGTSYSLVDMALWGWARAAHLVLGDDAMVKLPHVKRLPDEINARPAAQRVAALKAQFNFKTDMDAQARKAFFPHMA